MIQFIQYLVYSNKIHLHTHTHIKRERENVLTREGVYTFKTIIIKENNNIHLFQVETT